MKVYSLNNFVIIQPSADFTSIDGVDFIDTYDKHFDVSVRGIVVAVPDKLIYNGYDLESLKKAAISITERTKQRLIRNSMPWDTEMELKVGDEVFFRDFHQHGDKSVVMIEGVRHLAMPYSSVIARIDKDELYPLNGYLLLEKDIIKHEFFPDEVSVSTGYIAYEGKDNLHYLTYNTIPFTEMIGVGTKVLYRHKKVRMIEHPLHTTWHKHLLYIQKKDVIATLKSDHEPSSNSTKNRVSSS